MRVYDDQFFDAEQREDVLQFAVMGNGHRTRLKAGGCSEAVTAWIAAKEDVVHGRADAGGNRCRHGIGSVTADCVRRYENAD